MRKLRLYLDTSVLSHLFADDTPERMADTISFWDELKGGEYDVFVSDAGTIAEIDVCPEPKRTQMFAKLKEIKYTILKISPEVSSLAGAYIADNVLTKKSYDDCQHIAFAVVNSCDVIVSWNFKHLVNIRTIDGVKIVNTKNLYGEIKIVTPTMIIGGQNGRK